MIAQNAEARREVVPSNPLKADPTRTKMLRSRFETEFRKRFRDLKGKIRRLIVEEDVFGLKQQRTTTRLLNQESDDLVANQRWRFRSNADKVRLFQEWLQEQINAGIIPATPDPIEEQYWTAYVQEGYRKGAGRAFDDVRKPALASSADEFSFYQGTKQEFLRSAFGQPETIEKVKLLAGRVYTDLKGVTEAMATRLSRELTDGLVRGENPWTIASNINKSVDGIGVRRSLTIARTETIRAHAEGQLDAMERLGVEEVGVAVEWSTAGDDRVCPLCAPLEGVVMKLKEARGTIPRHPNCFFSGRTKVETASGPRMLKDVVVGDLVMTHLGRFKKVIETHKTPVSQERTPAIAIYVVGAGSIRVTSSHPVMLVGDNGEPYWSPAIDVRVGDRVLVLDRMSRLVTRRVARTKRGISHISHCPTLYNLSVEDDESYIANRIVVHNCRCSYLPAGVGEDKRGQKRTKARIQKAIDKSIQAEIPKRSKRSLATQKKRSPWMGAGKRISKKRPKPIV